MATNNGSAENKLHTAAPGDFEIMEIDTACVNTTQRTTQKGATASIDKGEIGQSNIVDGTGRQSSDEIRVKWNEEFGFPFEKNRSRIIRTELSKDGAVTGRDGVYKQVFVNHFVLSEINIKLFNQQHSLYFQKWCVR